MLFNSYYYIFLFLPIMIIAYFAVNRINYTLGKLLLVLGSIFFYSYGRIEVSLYIAVSILVNYTLALLARKTAKARVIIVLSCALNVGFLFALKYTNFAIANINHIFDKQIPLQSLIVPIGISFYTFQQISYTISVAKKEIEMGCFLDYLTYILFFPKILMGPLVEPRDFISQLNDETRKTINWTEMMWGIRSFSVGLIKKALIADTFSRAVSWGFENMETVTSVDCFLIMVFYTFEIYFDFSGYSDMAIGSASMLNFDLPINFDAPYRSLNIREFWKRWHITLTKFFTKYIYIPLGGSKKGSCRLLINTMIVFLISGIWHGANWTFIVWGLVHGIFVCFDNLLEKFRVKFFEPIRWILTLGIVNVLWLLFRAESVSQWVYMLKRMAFMDNTTVSEGIVNAFEVPETNLILNIMHLNSFHEHIRGFMMMAFIIVSIIICLLQNKKYYKTGNNNLLMIIITALLFSWGVLCLGTETTFVYMNF